jgi:hypothetical protein
MNSSRSSSRSPSRGRSRVHTKKHIISTKRVSRSRSREHNKSPIITRDKVLDFTYSDGRPLAGYALWAAKINGSIEKIENYLSNPQDNNDNLIKIDKVDSFDQGSHNRYKHKSLVKTNTIMIVQDDQIIGFGKFIAYETRLNRLHFDPYIKKENLNNYENYSRQPFFLEHAGEPSYNFYILKTSRNGGAIMRKSRKSRKSRKARKSRKM